jgi:transcription initiation factor TFIIIB Brf1 subunit/transcription initiation factor TFIIB
MKTCRKCKSKNLEHQYRGNGEDWICKDCGYIAHRVMVGGKMGRWHYYQGKTK